MDYELAEQPAFSVIGIAETVSNGDPGAVPKIEALWKRYFTDGIAARVPNAFAPSPVALYTDYQGDYTQPYLYVVGVRATAGTPAPEGLIAREVPAQTMAAFKAEGPLPEAVIETWQSVWSSDLKRSYLGDYDIYGPEGAPVLVFVGINHPDG